MSVEPRTRPEVNLPKVNILESNSIISLKRPGDDFVSFLNSSRVLAEAHGSSLMLVSSGSATKTFNAFWGEVRSIKNGCKSDLVGDLISLAGEFSFDCLVGDFFKGDFLGDAIFINSNVFGASSVELFLFSFV